MNNKFFSFIKPYLSIIDNGHLFRKPFSWLYTILAIINLIYPLYVLVEILYVVDENVLIVYYLLFWIFIAFASWVSFQLLWDRKSKIMKTSIEGDEFIATSVFSHVIQTIGEWFGTWIGIVGFSVPLLVMIYEEEYYYAGKDFIYKIGLGFLEIEWFFMVLMPIFGFLVIVTTRFIAEQIRALASIAYITKVEQSNKKNKPSF